MKDLLYNRAQRFTQQDLCLEFSNTALMVWFLVAVLDLGSKRSWEREGVALSYLGFERLFPGLSPLEIEERGLELTWSFRRHSIQYVLSEVEEVPEKRDLLLF